VLALNAALIRRGVYNLDEFRDAIERMAAGRLPLELVLREVVHGHHDAAGREGCRDGGRNSPSRGRPGA
jgi:hypothetical protein